MILRDYRKADAKVIAAWIRTEAELYQWSSDRFNRYPLSGDDIDANYAPQLKTGRFYPITAVDDSGNIVGHFIIRYPSAHDDNAVRFGFVIVNPVLRGRGCGTAMLRLGIEHVRKYFPASRIELGVFEHNTGARRCYETVGFQAYGTRACPLPIGTWNCMDMALLIERPID